MKEATGELNMTVITVVAIALIAGLFYAFIWPMIQQSIATNTCKAAYGQGYTALKKEGGQCPDTPSDDSDWCCVKESEN